MTKTAVKLVVFGASVRHESFNRRLAAAAGRIATQMGADVLSLELAAYPLPIYDGDLEADLGLPEKVQTLKKIFTERDGFIVASPEYNGSLSPLLKNMIDWMSRQGEDAESMLPFRGKIAGLLAASPGRLGGIRGLAEVRRVLSNIGTHVEPSQFALHGAGHAFDDDDSGLADEAHSEGVGRVVSAVIETAARLRR